jgi:hypothetical protein
VIVGAFYQGMLYKFVNGPLALISYVFAVWPPLARAIYSWFFGFFLSQRRFGRLRTYRDAGRFAARPGFCAIISSITCVGANARNASRSTTSAVEMGNL